MRSPLRVLAPLLLALALLAGCGGGDDGAHHHELLIVGIDSADWSLLDPMLDAGRLPHLAAFRAQAASGRMESLVPLSKSPPLWASICTGVPPAVHGIGGFVKGAKQAIVGASDWRAPALWDIAAPSGLTTTVLGMWSTHPARPIPGVMISDFLPYGYGGDVDPAGLVEPAELTERVLEHTVDGSDVPWSDLARFLPEGRLQEALDAFPRDMKLLRGVYAADMSYLENLRWLAKERPADITFFYLRGPDPVSHYFWAYREPEKSKHPVNPQGVELFAGVVERYYEFADEVLGEVLSWFPPGHPTVIVSDHGFYGPHPEGLKGHYEHTEWGVFLVRSPLYEAGARFDSLHIYDVGPTLLALLGLPPAQDMPGRILPDALTEEGTKQVEHLEANRIESYQGLRPAAAAGGVTDPAVTDRIREQLRSLGYIN